MRSHSKLTAIFAGVALTTSFMSLAQEPTTAGEVPPQSSPQQNAPAAPVYDLNAFPAYQVGSVAPIPPPGLPYLEQIEEDVKYQNYLNAKLKQWETAADILKKMDEISARLNGTPVPESPRAQDATTPPPELANVRPQAAPAPRQETPRFEVTEVFGSQATIRYGDVTRLVRNGDKVDGYTVVFSDDGSISMKSRTRNIVIHQPSNG